MSSTDFFNLLETARERGGTAEVLDRLADALREQSKYHELFEALKMALRHRLGLPLLYSDSGDELDEPRRHDLEEGLLKACREVGLLLLKAGQAGEGWMYMKAVGDKGAVCAALEQIEPDEEHLEDLISVMLHQGVDVERGFQLVLDHHGTCNAITTLDNLGRSLSPADRRTTAALLLRDTHQTLLSDVKAHIEKEEGTSPEETSIAELLVDREWLLADEGCHLDASHLASTVRHALVLTDPDLLRLAIDLATYGSQLGERLKYEGDEPFVDQYSCSVLFFEAQIDTHVEEAIAFFRERAQTVDAYRTGTQAAEVFIDLLTRLHRYDEATEALIEHLPPGTRTAGLAPTLLELAQKSNRYDRLKEISRQGDDLLSFSTALLEASTENSSR